MPFNRENHDAHRAYDQWRATTPERDQSTDRKVWIAAWQAARATDCAELEALRKAMTDLMHRSVQARMMALKHNALGASNELHLMAEIASAALAAQGRPAAAPAGHLPQQCDRLRDDLAAANADYLAAVALADEWAVIAADERERRLQVEVAARVYIEAINGKYGNVDHASADAEVGLLEALAAAPAKRRDGE